MAQASSPRSEATLPTREDIAALEAVLDESVEHLDLEAGADADGEPALWVWIVLRDDAPESAWSWENRQALRDKVSEGLRALGVSDWIYMRFRDASEVRDETRS